MHKIESSLSTRAGAADPRRGVLAWLRNRAAVPALSPAPVSTPIGLATCVGPEREGAIAPTCGWRPRRARANRAPHRLTGDKIVMKMQNEISREVPQFF